MSRPIIWENVQTPFFVSDPGVFIAEENESFDDTLEIEDGDDCKGTRVILNNEEGNERSDFIDELQKA